MEHYLRVMLYHYVLHVGTDGLVSEQLRDWIEKLVIDAASKKENKKIMLLLDTLK